MLVQLVSLPLLVLGLAHADPRENAIIALSQGRELRAIQLLTDGVSAGGEGAAELRCLLGRVQHQAGRHQDALQTLAAVLPEAPCALGAGWVRAEAMLALGQDHEAGEVYAHLGEQALGPGRDARTVQRLVDLADRVMAREEPSPDQAAAALTLALQLSVEPETELALARRLADLEMARARDHRGQARSAVPVLAAALTRGAEVEDRRRLAALVGGGEGLEILGDQPPDLDTQLLRLALGSHLDPGWRLEQLERLAAAHPQAAQTRKARLELGLELAAAGWRREAEASLAPVAEGQDHEAARAARALAELALRAGEDAEASQRLEELMRRFPRNDQRAWADEALRRLRWRRARLAEASGDHAEALAQLSWLAQQGDARAAYEAGVVARAMGDLAEARRRWEEIPARWPGSAELEQALWALFRLQARDQDDPEGALAWLEQRAAVGMERAAWLIEELERPFLAVDVVEDRPAVRVLSRGHETLELRLHRVDTEAWLRAGWSLEALPDLDLGIIEPDRVWQVEVPQAHPARIASFEVPVPVPGPGLYGVTVASTEREARTVLLHGTSRVVAQRVGPELAVAVFAGQQPLPGARVLVQEGGELRELRTDATGLARAEHRGSSLLILADSAQGPAFARLAPVDALPEDVSLITAVDLDRAVHRPGDMLGFRVAVDRAEPAERRDWELWLEGDDSFASLARHRFEERDDGTIVGELPLPLASTGHAGSGAVRRRLSLMGRRPDGVSQTLGVVTVADQVPEGRRLELEVGAERARIAVFEEDGGPAAGVPVDWRWTQAELGGRVMTDAAGRAELEAPIAGVPWTMEARLAGTDLVKTAQRRSEEERGLELLGLQRRLRSHEPLHLALVGEGGVTLRLVRLRAPEPAEAIEAPWDLEPRWLGAPVGPRSWEGPVGLDGAAVRETVSSLPLELAGARSVELPPLPEGRYEVELVAAAGDRRALPWSFEVDDDAPRLRAPPRVGAGQQLDLVLEGEPALVVLSSNEQVEAMVLRAGERRRLPASARWRAGVELVASTPSGSVQRQRLELLPAMSVALSLQESPEGWRLRAESRDAAGRPVRAQVALRAVDLGLEARVGRPVSASAGPLRAGARYGLAGAWGSQLLHGALSQAISQALLEEEAREEEARRAQAALDGRLMNNAVQAVLGEDVPLSLAGGLGGLGTRGYGGGGSGYGIGSSGGLIGARGAAFDREPPLQGERGRLLWAVLETDEQGRVELELPLPPRPGRYRIEAVALADGWVARDEQLLDSRERGPGPPREPAAARGLLASLALAEDPLAPWDPGRAAVAARSALAALPALEGAERQVARDRLFSLLGAVRRDPAAYGSGGEAAQALALLGELEALLTLPRDTAEAFSQAIATEGASRADRVALVHARALAGLPVDDASIARLLREPEALEDEEASQLARALILLERRGEARRLIRGDGPHALMAQRAISARRDRARAREAATVALLTRPAPPLGAPARPAWIAALPADLDRLPPAPSPEPLHPAEGCAQRVPLAADGLPLGTPTQPSPSGDLPCAPGRIALRLGETARVLGDLSRAQLSSGLIRVPDPRGGGSLVQAIAPGVHSLTGIRWGEQRLSLVVEVDQGEPDALAQPLALALAHEAWVGGSDPGPWLDALPRLEDWRPELQAEVAWLRFERAVRDGSSDAALVAAFEDLRDVSPDRAIGFEAVLATARAYRPTRPERAIHIQRSAIGAAFLDEASIAHHLERVMGPLAAIQVLWEIAGRYPSVPVVEQALYELPDRVLDMGAGGTIPPELREVGVTPTDLRLMSAAWNREFVALHPDSSLAPFAGRRLVTDLLHLSAWDRAAGWAARLAQAYPRHELEDSFLYLEGLARSGAGEHRQATALLKRVVRQRFVQPDGREGPSDLKADAELALARLLEAQGDREGALRAYEQAAGQLGEAQASLLQLRTRTMALEELTLLAPGEPALLPVTVAGVDRLFLRAYRLDLRTLFLRDGGLAGAAAVQVAGISPAWSGERSLRESPFPREHELRLPLAEPGAWLVQLHAGDTQRSVLVVRSELELATSDAAGLRRVTVLRRGRPAAGVQVRALAGGQVVAAVTDQRGVAVVPAFAPTLAFDGPHYAFTTAREAGASSLDFDGGDELLRRLDERLEGQRELRRSRDLHLGVRGGFLEASEI